MSCRNSRSSFANCWGWPSLMVSITKINWSFEKDWLTSFNILWLNDSSCYLINRLLILHFTLLGALHDHLQLLQRDQLLIQHELQEVRWSLYDVTTILSRVDAVEHPILVDPINNDLNVEVLQIGIQHRRLTILRTSNQVLNSLQSMDLSLQELALEAPHRDIHIQFIHQFILILQRVEPFA